MTQQTQGDAVGGASDTVVTAEPTIPDRFAAVTAQAEEKRPEEEAPTEEAVQAEAEQALAEGDVPEEEAPSEEDAAPIPPPVSWKDEDKALFGQLPPDVQKVIAGREADREKFLQEKSQEAKQTRQSVEREALTYLQHLQANHAQALQGLMVPVPDKPAPMLQADDPWTYAEQMQAHENALAHNAYIEQHVSVASTRSQQAHQMAVAQEAQETQAILAERFPEYLDAEKGPKLRQELGSIASELGFSQEQLKSVNATDILAFKTVSEWKGDALKYRTLMAKQMEKVRDAKNLPALSRPGAAQPKGAAANQRYEADRNAMKRGDKDAGARVFGRFI